MFEEKTDWVGKPGTKEAFSLRVGEMPNGAPYLIPVLVVTGASEGPTFFVNAAMHGDEVLGTDIVVSYWSTLDPADLGGRLIALPMAYHVTVGTRSRRNPVEMYPGPLDMNRVFPGSASGSITERIAAVIMERFVLSSDYTFDIHSASVGGAWEGYTAVPSYGDGPDALVERSRGLGKAFGTRLVLEGLGVAGSLSEAAFRAGKVSSMVEFGVANHSLPEERAFGETGLTNLLRFAGMVPGEVADVDGQVTVEDLVRLRSDRGGFLRLTRSVGDGVEAEGTVAQVLALDGRVVQEIKSPVDGLVCRINTMGVIGTGDLVADIGR